jgi:hypothetical protein
MVPRALAFAFPVPTASNPTTQGLLHKFSPITAASSGNLAPKAGDERAPLAETRFTRIR